MLSYRNVFIRNPRSEAALLKISESEAIQALVGRLVIEDAISWSTKNHLDWAKSELKVFHDNLGEMKMLLSVSLVNGKSTYSLMFRGTMIKRLDVNGTHRSFAKGERLEFIRKTHKHILTDDCGLSWAYLPDDITSDNPQVAFEQFCVECNIQFCGNWTPLPQSPLEL